MKVLIREVYGTIRPVEASQTVTGSLYGIVICNMVYSRLRKLEHGGKMICAGVPSFFA